MPMFRFQHPRYRALAVLAAFAIGVAACSDDPSSPNDDNSLDGFVAASRDDSAGSQQPHDTLPDGPGRFKGLVKGYTPGVVDTNSTLVLLANVKVTAYEREGDGNPPVLGDPVAQTFSNAQGRWELPTLPGGEYIVTFVPPASSGYRSGWTIGWAWPGSGNNDWGIHLPKAED